MRNTNQFIHKEYNFRVCFISKILLLTVAISLVNSLTSCKKFLEISPPKDRLISTDVFTNDNTATSAIIGIYSDMMQTFKIFSDNTTYFTGLESDEVNYLGTGTTSYIQFQNDQLTSNNTDVNQSWTDMYKYVYDANVCLAGIQASTGIDPPTKSQLLGEAKFIRAFSYFYLTNLFGDVPLITTTDYSVSSVQPRNSQNDIYKQIISDLLDAQTLLPTTYVTAERVRPNYWTATALLARVYIYTQDWSDAETQSTAIINAGTYLPLPSLSNVFLKTSNETIWQLMPVSTLYNTLEGNQFVGIATSRPSAPITASLINSFESGDQRRTNWVGTSFVASTGLTYYYPYKYKIASGNNPLNEYYVVFRLSEQYLIRAEARAEQATNLTGSIADINVIRTRAGLPSLSSSLTQTQVLSALEQERRIEFFVEWGHRWMDLKRTNRVGAVIGALKPTWQSTAALWPIPLNQINANPNLTQNPSY